jgi:hypothetical protein
MIKFQKYLWIFLSIISGVENFLRGLLFSPGGTGLAGRAAALREPAVVQYMKILSE